MAFKREPSITLLTTDLHEAGNPTRAIGARRRQDSVAQNALLDRNFVFKTRIKTTTTTSYTVEHINLYFT